MTDKRYGMKSHRVANRWAIFGNDNNVEVTAVLHESKSQLSIEVWPDKIVVIYIDSQMKRSESVVPCSETANVRALFLAAMESNDNG